MDLFRSPLAYKFYKYFFQKNTPDEELIADVANILEVSEFDMLRIAYYKWYNEEGDLEGLEQLYGHVLMGEEELPLWARSYFREIQDAYQRKDRNRMVSLISLNEPKQ